MLTFIVSALSWLENDVFLMAHTSSSFDTSMPPPTTFTLVTRQKDSAAFTFQRFPEVCGPFGLNRSPPCQFIQRLKSFPPSMQDLIVVASTASEDIGLFTKSEAPLTSEVPAEKIVKVFTTTTMANDSRRATVPMTEDMTSNTSPVGVALDLSSKDPVPRPLPGEEMDASSTPLPALMILNNEGVLAAWWIIYADSIRQRTAYPGLTAVTSGPQKQAQQAPDASAFGSTLQQMAPAFGQSTFGAPSSTSAFGSTLNKPAVPAFGNPSMPGTASGAFGAPSGIGNKSSPWSTTTSAPQAGGATFGATPAFGSSAPAGGAASGSAFGTSGALGSRQSPWGAPSSGTTAGSGAVFGQSGGLGMRTGSPFGTTQSPTFGSNTPAAPSSQNSGGFASFAKAGGFAAASAAQGNGGSVLSNTTPAVSFGSAMDTGSSFGETPKKNEQAKGGLFSAGGGFILGSSFKGDGSAEDDDSKPPANSNNSFFDDSFSRTLGDAQKSPVQPPTKETDMASNASDKDDDLSSLPSPVEEETTTPADTPAPSKFFSTTTAPPITGGLFGTQAQSKITPAAVQNSTPAAFHDWTPFPATNTQPEKKSPVIKPEQDENFDGVSKDIPEAPLPPDPRSKTSYTPSGSSGSSPAASKTPPDDAPLPPDFLSSKSKPKSSNEKPVEQPALPADDDDDGLDDEGSGVDVAQDVSPISESNQSPKMTPESSFGMVQDKSPLGGLFTTVTRQHAQQPSKQLFGEVGKTSAPFFPPPSKVQESPRSPSPIRSSALGDVLRPDNVRSISAPGQPTKPVHQRTTTTNRTLQPLGTKNPQVSAEEQWREEQARLAAQKARQEAEEDQELSDHEDERVREELASEVEATLTLEPFLAHQDYVGNINKSGIPGQIEKVYRDINSMIDTLGLNARSLEAFTKGHSEFYKDGGRSREDLDNEDDWCLVEIEDLGVVENSLQEQLEETRLHGVQDKINSCRELQKDLSRIRSKHNDIKRIVDSKSDPDEIEALRSAPLTAEQTSIQQDLRKDFTSFQKLLAEAEEGIVMLRAKLASHNAANGKANGPGFQKAPTVEAVTNTILKMTSMVEKKSGDIDVLEIQMRRLKGFSLGGESRDSSREASPFVTPPTSTRKSKAVAKTPVTAGSFHGNAFFTPRSSRSLFASSVGSDLTPSRMRRKRLEQVQAEDVRRYGVKTKRRKEVNGLLKEVLGKGGVRVRTLDDV